MNNGFVRKVCWSIVLSSHWRMYCISLTGQTFTHVRVGATRLVSYFFSSLVPKLFLLLFIAGRAWDQGSAWSFKAVWHYRTYLLYSKRGFRIRLGFTRIRMAVFTSCWRSGVNMLSKKELEELRPWVSERVTAFLGFSEDTVVNAALDCVAKSLSRQATTG